MSDSAVVLAMRANKAAILRGEEQSLREMASTWLQVERRLQGQIDALALEMSNLKRDGGTVSRELLFRDERYRQLMVQVSHELEWYGDYAERTIEGRQRQLAGLGIRHAGRAISDQGVRVGFARLPIESVEYLVGLAGDGSPINALIRRSWPLAAEGITRELINGVALGYNPRKTARMMAEGATDSLQRMMVISRTESLRAYRHTSLESYRVSGVVTSYVRLSARDSRVCPGCLAADSEEYDLATDFQSHPQCRCTLIPKIQGIPLRFQSGAEWFEEQSATTQRDILGLGRYKLWATGEVTNFKEFMTVRENATWGDAIVPTPLKELV